ncbi:flagellar filament capping protein FliD [Granulicella cerasi]|uniref:Flagellar hook-associated protein 2 n=1 Tax=Granulicella cerasi TaxID=741063 RepID=A0ABW1ZE76_9BACT|nr:flagellar filament capping protein FliD [Granulicella cerasi]
MATIGLSFGSATSGAGFDVASTVSQIIAIQQAVETPWKTQLTNLKSQDTELSTLGTELATVATDLQSLTDFEGVMAQKNGSSSDTSIVSLSSASSSAVAGSHEIVVSQLAQTSSVYTQSLASGTTIAGSITIQVGSGTAQTIDVSDSQNTLSGLAAAINSVGMGVTASVISDTNGQRLSIVSATSGSAGQLTIASNLTNATSGSSIATQVGHNGQDAQLTVDGISMTSASNTVTSAIPGVTFQILSTSTSAVQVEITNDTASIATAINTFVTDYNKLATEINTQSGKDSSGNEEPLAGSRTLALLQEQLTGALVAGGGQGAVTSLSQLGIAVNQDGTLSFTQSTALSALNENFADAVAFFQNSGSFGVNLTSTLTGLSSTATTGAIYLALKENSSQESTLNDDIDDQEDRIASQKTRLTTELNNANEILQSIPSQLSEIDQMYAAITGYNEKG